MQLKQQNMRKNRNLLINNFTLTKSAHNKSLKLELNNTKLWTVRRSCVV